MVFFGIFVKNVKMAIFVVRTKIGIFSKMVFFTKVWNLVFFKKWWKCDFSWNLVKTKILPVFLFSCFFSKTGYSVLKFFVRPGPKNNISWFPYLSFGGNFQYPVSVHWYPTSRWGMSRCPDPRWPRWPRWGMSRCPDPRWGMSRCPDPRWGMSRCPDPRWGTQVCGLII